MRKINTRFFAILVAAGLLLAGTVFGLHRLQASNITDALLWQANQAEKDGKLNRAAKFLTRYLEFAREDLDQRERLGMILSEPAMATTMQRRARARFAIEQVLAKDPDRHLLRQRLCLMALQEHSFTPAKEHLNYLEKHRPDSADVPLLAGQWYEGQNQLPKAAECYRRANQLDGAKGEAYARLVNVLQQLDFGKEPRHAEEIDRLIRAALKNAPQDAGVISLAAQHAQEQGDSSMALKYLERGLKDNPTDPRIYLTLARIHVQKNTPADAIAMLELGLQKVRKDQQFELRWTLANLLLDENRAEESKKLIAEIREVNRVSADYLDARRQMQRGRWFEAAQQFERIRPSLKTARALTLQLDLALGLCYEQLEEPVLQQMAFQRAADADASSLVARRGLANACWALGQTGEALQIYQDLVTRTKNPEESARRRLEYVRLLLQASHSRHAKDWQKIEAELDQVEKALPNALEAPLMRADLFYLRGDKDKAERLLHEMIKQHADRHEPWLALVSFAMSKEDYDTARQLLKTAEARFKDKMEFRLAQIRVWARQRAKEISPEMRQLEKDLDRFKPQEQSALLQALAEVAYDAQKYADAGRLLQRMMKMPQHGQDVRLRLQMLEVVLLQDDDVQARAVLDDLKRLGEDGTSADWSFGEALRLMRAGRKGQKGALDQARHLLTVAAAQRPNWQPIVQARAELDELQGRDDQAIANYRRALDLGCRDPQVMKQLIQLLSLARRFDEVEEVIGRMQKLYGTTDDVVKGFVQNAYQRNDYKKAEFLARQLVAKNSKSYRDHLWLGQVLSLGHKQSSDAEQAFRQAVVLGPEHPETWINLVRYLAVAGSDEAARAVLQSARKALPSQLTDYTLAQCHEMLGNLDAAEKCYKTGLKEQPNSAALHRAAGDFYLRNSQPAPAVMLYRMVVEQKIPSNDEEMHLARRGLALSLVQFHHPAATAEALQLVGLKQDEKGNVAAAQLAASAQEQLMQAKVLGATNHHRLRGLAITLLETLQHRNLLRGDDQFFLARLWSEQQRDAAAWKKTRTLLKSLVDQHPKSPRMLAFSAHQHMRHKEFNDAEQLLARLELVEQERKLPAGGYGSIELRAKLLELRGLGAQAVVLLTRYAAQPGAAPVRKLLIASLQGRLGQFHAAIDLCEEVRKGSAKPQDAIGMALAILRHNQPEEAQASQRKQWFEQRERVEKVLRDLVQASPQDIAMRLHLADMMELQGQYAEVEKLCRAVLRQQDTNLVALNNLAWLLGQQADKAAEALILINRAIDKHGPRPELLDTRGVVQLAAGNPSAAIRDLERVANEAPTPAYVYHLSRAYKRAQNSASALALLRQANDMGLTLQHLHPVEHAEYQRVIADLRKQPG